MAVLLTIFVSNTFSGQLSSALTHDKAYPAAMQSSQIPSHEGKLDALMYIAVDELVAKIHALEAADAVTAVHLPTDHSYNDHRIAPEIAFLNWPGTLH